MEHTAHGGRVEDREFSLRTVGERERLQHGEEHVVSEVGIWRRALRSDGKVAGRGWEDQALQRGKSGRVDQDSIRYRNWHVVRPEPGGGAVGPAQDRLRRRRGDSQRRVQPIGLVHRGITNYQIVERDDI